MVGLFSLPPAPPAVVLNFSISGVKREAVVFAPTVKSATKPPIVFMFHGHGGSANRCVGRFHVEKQWPQAVVVYPDGLPISQLAPGLPVSPGQGWELACNESNRDLQFFDALRSRVLHDFGADPKRQFAMGFSNGGMFVFTLWTMRAREFAGFCPSGAALVSADMKLRTPVPCFSTISTDDPNFPALYQRKAVEAIRVADKSSAIGTPYGAKGQYFKGKAPVVVWTYAAGHEFPFDGFANLIQFFKSAKPT
jgi:polyhydroxybutyrate depolymerase